MPEHWLASVTRLLTADTGDLKELAAAVGADPRTFYRGADLSRADLSGQDLRGMDFTNANLTGAILDDKTKIDPEFDPVDPNKAIIRVVAIPIDLMKLVSLYQRKTKYGYAGWALKSLIETAHGYHIFKHEVNWSGLIQDNPDLRPFIYGQRRVHYRINIKQR